MPATTKKYERLGFTRTLEQTLTAVGSTDWVALSGEVAVQVTGAATAATFIVERSTRNPGLQGVTANTVAAGAAVDGAPNTGISPVIYREPGVAWYRARMTAITGANAVFAINGGAA